MAKIVTLTMNPAVDLSTKAERISANKKIRCDQPRHEPGGGGINVARAIVRLGGEAMAIFPAGGSTGKSLSNMLEQDGVAQRMYPLGKWTRENVTVRERGGEEQYRFIMPGPELSEDDWKACLEEVAKVQGEADFLVASGSLPPGAPDDFYAKLADQLAKDHVKMLLDTSGEALNKGAVEGVYLLKPNRRELGHLAGEDISDEEHEEKAARSVLDRGCCNAMVLSLGAAGAKLFNNEASRHFRAPTVDIASKTGAGDSMMAGIVLSLAKGEPLEKAVRFGVAAGAAAVTTPGSALCDRELTEKLFEKVSSQVTSPVSEGPI